MRMQIMVSLDAHLTCPRAHMESPASMMKIHNEICSHLLQHDEDTQWEHGRAKREWCKFRTRLFTSRSPFVTIQTTIRIFKCKRGLTFIIMTFIIMKARDYIKKCGCRYAPQLFYAPRLGSVLASNRYGFPFTHYTEFPPRRTTGPLCL